MGPGISLIGLGKLGVCMAACLADAGFRVTGVDVDAGRVRSVNDKVPPVTEPGLGELLQECGDRLEATLDCRQAVLATDVTFVVVPTPSEPDGRFSLRFVLDACKDIGGALAEKESRHLVVVTSTVMPGDTDGEIRPLLEAVSGKKCGEDFGLCYSPEFIALGSVLWDYTHPDFLLIGESDARSGEDLAGIYARVCRNDPPARRMNFANAELTKLSVNTYVTTKISFANMIASICERLHGTDADVVTETLGLDRRIGPRYLKGATSYGGPCFPRDNLALASLGRSIGAPPILAEATDALNRHRLRELTDLVLENLPEGGTAAVLGLAYKPDTNVAEESPGLSLALQLADRGVSVSVHDPLALPAAIPALAEHPEHIDVCDDVDACIQKSDVVVVTTPWGEYRELSPERFATAGRTRIVIDCWRIYPGMADSCPGVVHLPLGVGKPAGPMSKKL